MQALHSRNIPFPPPPVKNGNQPLNLYFPIAIFAEKRYSIQRTLQDLQYIPETIKIQGKCTIHIFFIQLFPLLRRTGLHRNCLGPFRIVPAQPRRHATDARTVFFPFGKGDEVKAPCNECRLAGAPVFTGPSANADARQKKTKNGGGLRMFRRRSSSYDGTSRSNASAAFMLRITARQVCQGKADFMKHGYAV